MASLKRKRERSVKRWTHEECKLILMYLMENKDIERPTARIYYQQLLEKTKIKDAYWELVKHKVRYIRCTFEKADKFRKSAGAEQEPEDVWKKVLNICPYYDLCKQIFPEKKRTEMMQLTAGSMAFKNSLNEWRSAPKTDNVNLVKSGQSSVASSISVIDWNSSPTTDNVNLEKLSKSSEGSSLLEDSLEDFLAVADWQRSPKTTIDDNDDDILIESSQSSALEESLIDFNSSSNIATDNAVAFELRTPPLTMAKIKSKINIGNETKSLVTSAVTKWTIQNCRPFSIINDSGIKDLISLAIDIGSRFGRNVNIEQLLPHSTTISRDVTKLYNKELSSLMEEIALIKENGYTITFDSWTDNFSQKLYVCITVHYIIEGSIKNRLLAMLCMNVQSITGVLIRKKVQACLETFGLNLDDAIIVTDRGSNMMGAFEELSQIHCINHLLNNAVEKAFNEVPQLHEIAQKIEKLVKYFTRSGQNFNIDLNFKIVDRTRWNTIYYTMKFIEDNWHDITTILLEKNEMHLIDSLSLSDLKDLTHVISKIEETSKFLEGDSYPTIQWVIPRIYALQKLCNDSKLDKEIIKKLKSTLAYLIDTEILNYVSEYHRVALFLFPPTNQLRHLDCKQIIGDCKNMMRLSLSSDNEHKDLKSNSKEFDEFLADFVEPQPAVSDEEMISREIVAYSNIRLAMYGEFNVLNWWRENKYQFPLLYTLSCKIFSIPATIVTSERVFLQARNLICEKRNSTGDNEDMVNQIMFLHMNMRK